MRSSCEPIPNVVLAVSDIEQDGEVRFSGIDLDSGEPTVVSISRDGRPQRRDLTTFTLVLTVSVEPYLSHPSRP